MSQAGIDGLRIVLPLQLLVIHTDKLLAATNVFAKTIVRNAIKPRGKACFAAKGCEFFVRAQKGFLCKVVGQSNIGAGKLPKQAAHAGLMPPHELSERVLIVISKNSRDEVRIR
jgi:hypothetical protein